MGTLYQRAGVAFQQGAPAGASVDTARLSKTPTEAARIGSVFGNSNNGFQAAQHPAAQWEASKARMAAQMPANPEPGLSPGEKAFKYIGDFYTWYYDGWSTGVRTAYDVSKGDDVGVETWKENWHKQQNSAGSLGQSMWLATSGWLNDKSYDDAFAYLDDPELNTRSFDADGNPTRTDREEFFNSGAQKWVTGTLDFAANIFLDPTIVASKVTAPLRATLNAAKAVDVAEAAARSSARAAGASPDAINAAGQNARLGTQAIQNPGDEASRLAGSGATRGANRIQATVDRAVAASERVRTDAAKGIRGGYAQLASTKFLGQGADAGAISYFMQRIDTQFAEKATREDLKQAAIYAGMGDRASLARLEQMDSVLALELAEMVGPNRVQMLSYLASRPEYSRFETLKMLTEDAWYAKVAEVHHAKVQAFRDGLDRVREVGSDGVLQGDALAATRGVGGLSKLTTTNGALDFLRVGRTFQLGKGLPRVHALVGTHLPGAYHLSGDEAVGAFKAEIESARKVVKHDKGHLNQLAKFLDDFTVAHSNVSEAASRADRRTVWLSFNKFMTDAMIANRTRGLSGSALKEKTDQIKDLIMELRQGAKDEADVLRSRVQSAASNGEDGWVVDGNGEDMFMFPADAAERMFAGRAWAGTQGEDLVQSFDFGHLDHLLGSQLAEGLNGFMRRKADGAWELTDKTLTSLVNGWKFQVLARLGYPIRNATDTQARMGAMIGALQVMHNGIVGTGNWAHNIRRVPNDVAEWAWKSEALHERLRDIEHILDDEPGRITDVDLLRERDDIEKFLADGPSDTAVTGKLNKENSVRVGQTPLARHLGMDQADPLSAYPTYSEWLKARRGIGSEESTLGLLTDTYRSRLGRTRAAEQSATQDYKDMVGTHARWENAYTEWVNHIVRNDRALMGILAGESDDWVKRYYRTTHEGRAVWKSLRKGWNDNLDEMIAHQREQMDKTIPQHVRGRILGGEMREVDAKEAFRVQAERPAIPTALRASEEKHPFVDLFDRTRTGFFKFAADMPETMMGRHPFYVDRFNLHMQRIVDNAGGRESVATLSRDQIHAARKRADILARKDVGRYLFDTSEHSNLAHHLRFVSAFYTAWSDTMRKWGRIIGEHPEMAPILYKAYSSANAAFLVTDEDGNRILPNGRVIDATGDFIRQSLNPAEGYINFTLPGFASKFAKQWLGTDSFHVSKNALNTIFQGDPFILPGPGPMVQVPVNAALTGTFPELGPNGMLGKWINKNAPPLADGAVGGYILSRGTSADGVLPQIEQPALRNFQRWMFGTLKDEPFQQTYAKLMADELNAIRNDGRPMPSQAKLSKLIENRTRNWYLIQGLSSEAGFQVQPTSRLEFWRNEFHNYRRELGPDAPEAFYRDFPDYFEATITLSVNETGLNATDDSWREAVKYRDDINTNLKYGWLYAGAANMAPGFDNGVYTAQQAAGWRSQKSPAEAAKENVVSQGWIQYRDFAGLLNTKLETRKANGGKITITAKSNADLKDYRDKFVDQLTRENPAWREDYDATGSGSSLREFFDVTEQAKKDHPELAKRGDFEALAKYREGRAIVQDQLANVGLRSLDSYEATSIREAWETWVANLVNSDLGFQQMYQRARLETDDLSVVAENEK